jgi:acetolactate synthase-1/2/3 large subunit
MRVCDWISDYLYNLGIENVHGIMGGGASGLNDGFIKNGKINYICYHNEQGAGHSAMGEAIYTGKVSVVNPTTGCAGTNCATSVLDAWQDGVPVLFISGNVRMNTCSSWINTTKNINLRKYGIQEHNVVSMYKNMTKYAHFITSIDEVAYVITKALYMAKEGRPGPCWVDIPGDIQTAEMPETYKLFIADDPINRIHTNLDELKNQLEQSERPVVLVGQGIRQTNTVDSFIKFIEKYKLPFVTTYGATDYASNDHELNMGAIGIKGCRYGNFVVQNASLLLVLGSSLNSSVIGYDPKQFSIGSKKIVVDIDSDELNKDILDISEKYNMDLSDFFEVMV